LTFYLLNNINNKSIKKGALKMTHQNEPNETVLTKLVNQPVDKEAYKKIKVIAAIEEKKIQEVFNDAIVYYSKHWREKK
jgi:hypothetical protein